MAGPDDDLSKLEQWLGAPSARITVTPQAGQLPQEGGSQGDPLSRQLDELDKWLGAPTQMEPNPGTEPPPPTIQPLPAPPGPAPLRAGPLTFSNLPPQDPEIAAHPQIGPVDNALRAMNDKLARTLALPPEALNSLITAMGLGLVPEGQITQWSKDAFEKLGIRTEPINGLSSQMGGAVFNGAMTTLAFMAAAPYMAAKTGMTASALIQKHLGESIIKNPGLVTWADTVGSMGTEYGKHLTEGIQDPTVKAIAQPAAELAGGLVGGVGGQLAGQTAGAITRGVAGATNKMVVNPAKNLVNTVTGREVFDTKGPALPSSLVPRGFDPNNTTLGSTLENELKNDYDKVYTGIAQAIERVPTTGTPAEVQERFSQLLGRADKIARRVEKEKWSAVDQTRLVDPRPLYSATQAIRTRMGARLSSMPTIHPSERLPTDPVLPGTKQKVDNFLDLLDVTGRPLRDPATGRMVKSLPSIEQLFDIKGRVARSLRQEKKSEAPNDGKIANYAQVLKAIDDTLDASFPNDRALAAARKFSTTYHDLFDRGGIADITAYRYRGDEKVDPGQKVEALMGKFKGLQELLAMRQALTYARSPRGGFAITAGERREVQALVGEAENSLRSMFREAAGTMSPEDAGKAAQWFQRHEKSIRPMARLHGELAASVADVFRYQKHLDDVKSGTLQRVVGMEPEKAIQRVWSSQRANSENKQLLRALASEPDALDAYQKGVLQHFWNVTKMDPVKAKEVMETPRYKQFLYDTLTAGGSDSYGRLKGMVDSAYTVSTKGERAGVKAQKMAATGSLMLAGAGAAAGGANMFDLLQGPATLAAGVVGAGLGRWVSAKTGGGTVQVPGMFASNARRIMDNVFKQTSPDQLLTMAVVDPRWERILLDRNSSNAERTRQMLAYTRRFLVTLNAGREIAVDQLAGEAP